MLNEKLIGILHVNPVWLLDENIEGWYADPEGKITMKNKGILCILFALLITAVLTVVYSTIGLQSDIRYAKKQCTEKIDSLAVAVAEVERDANRVAIWQQAAYRNYVELCAYPFREEARQLGDDVIGLHGDGCVVRLKGDALIAPEGLDLSSLVASDLTDDDGTRLDWGIYMKRAGEADVSPTFRGFCRVYEDYYYIDLADPARPFDLMDTFIDPYTEIAEMERVYGGHIVVCVDDSLIYVSQGIDPSVDNLEDLGISADAPDPKGLASLRDSVDIIEVNGESCIYALSEPFSMSDEADSTPARAALIVSIEGLSTLRIPRLVLALCVTLLFFITAVCWVQSAMQVCRNPSTSEKQRSQYDADHVRRSVMVLGIVGVLSVGLVTFFINCLIQLYTVTENNNNLLESYQREVTAVQGDEESIEAWWEDVYVHYARCIADTLASHPEYNTRKALEEMSRIVGADYLMTYDDRGREKLSNAPYVNLAFSADEAVPESAFRKLLTGVPSIILDPGVDAATLLDRQLVGVCMDDGDIADGYGALIMAMMPDKQTEDANALNRRMEAITPQGSLFLALNPETGDILNASEAELISKNALSLGMTDRVLQGDTIDHFTLNAQRWYGCFSSDGERVYVSAVLANAIFRRLPTVALSFSGCFLVAYAILALLLLAGYPHSGDVEPAPGAAGRRSTATAARPAHNSRLLLALRRLSANPRLKIPERRTRLVFSLTSGIMLAVLLYALQINAEGRNRFFILYYVLNGKWTPGFNLFAFAKILIIGLGVTLALLVFNLVVDIICALLQKRSETIFRLVSSFIQYFVVLAYVFSVFDSLGLDGRTLLASVGILSLAVSMGAQSLVADVLAGITIAFSDEYQIDDYIEVNGFCGWVQDIGIRSTVLVNNDGNLKHFNNRDIRNILNLSRSNCSYTINITLDSNQPLKEVEELLQRELPKIAQAIPEIIEGPEYKGVVDFTTDEVTIAISTVCMEQNYGKVRRNINREIWLLLEENGIIAK